MPRKKKTTEPLVAVVVVTHGRSADALVATARAILGAIPALAAVSVRLEETFDMLVDRISEACEGVDEGGGVLIMVDIHGSSPFNAAMAMLDGTRPAEVLCGVNLPMLVKLATMNRRLTAPSVMAEELRDAGRRSIRLGTELTGRVSVTERR